MVHPSEKKTQFRKFLPMYTRGVCIIPRIGADGSEGYSIGERRDVYSCKIVRFQAILARYLQVNKNTHRNW